jgi:hypothetical protein
LLTPIVIATLIVIGAPEVGVTTNDPKTVPLVCPVAVVLPEMLSVTDALELTVPAVGKTDSQLPGELTGALTLKPTPVALVELRVTEAVAVSPASALNCTFVVLAEKIPPPPPPPEPVV